MEQERLRQIKEEYSMYGLPDYMWGPMGRYLTHGIMPGGFLTAVLENDLSKAVGKADATNIELLKEWVGFVYMYVPAIAWGSPRDVQNWSELKRNQLP